MHRIHALPDHLVNQIAAGEVVERPAAALKEIVENSLDAGATHIGVELAGGGIKLIRVTDNGSGIHADDLPLALSRHATSKIKQLHDLEHVRSMGFRGEGLASIASVSRLTLTSRTADLPHAHEIRAEDGVLSAVNAAAHPEGTTVEVRELFFNTPARRKFLKSENTEYAHCAAMLERLALANPQAAFSLAHNGKTVFRYPVQSLEERMAAVMGAEFRSASLPVESSEGAVRVHGFVSKPTFAKGKSELQFCFVNRRFVRDKVVLHAVKQAYRDVLHHKITPAFVLFLEMPPEMVDVNVHPTKTEIRFRDSQAVHRLVFHTLDKALEGTRADMTGSVGNAGDILQQRFPNAQSSLHTETAVMPTYGEAPSAPAPYSAYRAPQQRSLSLKENRAALQTYAELYRRDDDFPIEKAACTPKQPAPETEAAEPPEYPLGFALAQLLGIYILAQTAEGLILVDMHAAAERVNYEKMKAQRQQGSLQTQMLLIPPVFAASHTERAVLAEHGETLREYGLLLSDEGNGQIAVRSVPAMLGKADAVELAQNVLRELGNVGSSHTVESMENRIFATMACHGSVRAGRQLTLPEMNALLRDLALADLDALFLRGQ